MESGRLHPGEIQTRSEPTDRQPVGERRQTGSRYGDSRSRHPPRGIEEGHVSLILEAVLDSGAEPDGSTITEESFQLGQAALCRLEGEAQGKRRLRLPWAVLSLVTERIRPSQDHPRRSNPENVKAVL